jgi:glutamate decarboxylase
MVHLSAIHREGGANAAGNAAEKVSRLANKAHNVLKLSSDADEFTTSVYGSRFAEQELPKLTMPECAMPREIAYRLINDDLSLDNNPKLKYAAHFRTQVMFEALS